MHWAAHCLTGAPSSDGHLEPVATRLDIRKESRDFIAPVIKLKDRFWLVELHCRANAM